MLAAHQILGSPSWLTWVGTAASTTLPLLIEPALARRAERRDRAATERSIAPGARNGKLPRLSSVALATAGVHPSITAALYVPRDAEAQFLDSVRASGRALITGPSMSGKTRLALEAAAKAWPKYRFWAPADARSVQDALREAIFPRKTVIWLDDLERYLGVDGVTPAILDRFAANRNLLIATIRTKELEALTPTAKGKPVGSTVVDWFGEPVWLNNWTNAELSRADAVLGAGVATAAGEHGLSQYLGGAPLLRRRLRLAEAEDAAAYALARIAADWRRMGLHVPLRREVITPALLFEYGAADADEAAIDAAVAWTSVELGRGVSIIQVRDGSLHVVDLVVDWFEEVGDSVPDAMWDRALETAKDRDLVDLGAHARYVHGREDVAERAWEKADRPDARAYLGQMLVDRYPASSERAEELLRRALQEGVDGADLPLAILLEKVAGGASAYVAEADELYQRAGERGDPVGAFNAGGCALRRTPPDQAAAERWFRRALDLGHAWAAGALGQLLMRNSQSAEVEDLLRGAALSSSARPSDQAAFGVFLDATGRANEGESWLRKAASSGDGDTIASLCAHLIRSGGSANLREAVDLAARCAALGVQEGYSMGASALEQLGDSRAADAVLRDGIAAGVNGAQLDLGRRLVHRAIFTGDSRAQAEATRLLSELAAVGNSDAALELASLEVLTRGAYDEALKWLVIAHVERPDEASHARATTLLHRGAPGDDAEAKAILSELLQRDISPEMKGSAAHNLAIILEADGDVATAERYYRMACQLGRVVAMVTLADLLTERGGLRNRVEAARWRRRSKRAHAADPDQIPSARGPERSPSLSGGRVVHEEVTHHPGGLIVHSVTVEIEGDRRHPRRARKGRRSRE